MKIGFIGLGIMGSRMAANLLEAGYSINIYNRSAVKAVPLVDNGAVLMKSPKDLAEQSDIVITMLSNPDVVRSIAEMEGGLFAADVKDKIWLDCSTVNPSFVRDMQSKANELGYVYMDTPVAGSKSQAENKELIFIVGGSEDKVKSLSDIFNAMGSRFLHVGEVGMGASYKLLVNNLLAQSMATFAETVILGQKMGLDKEFLLDSLSGLPLVPPYLKFKVDAIKENNYDVHFPLELMVKDLHLVATSAYETGTPMVQSNATKELMQQANQSGLSRMDFSAIYKFMEENYL